MAAESAGADRRYGDRPPTIIEVAAHAGVSIATVSRVVSGRGHVREATRRRVEQAIAATGWAVNPAARQLAGGMADEVVLAVAVADSSEFASDPYYARVIADFTRPGAARAAGRLLETTPDVDAIFVASDLMATAVLQVLTAGGRRVPDDVAVVGFDDSPPAWMTMPALSTVHQPVEKLAALAVRTLTDRGAPLDQRLPTRLVVRASSAA